MDLQDFTNDMLYFQEQQLPEVEQLVNRAANNYGRESETCLLRALSLDPGNLLVLVGLYRFYYYQHRYEDALLTADRVMQVVGARLDFPADWRDITMHSVNNGVMESFCLVRLYFFALKAAGYIYLRLNRFAEGKAMLEKVVAMDSADRMGAKLLLEVLGSHTAEVVSFPGAQKVEARKSCQLP